MKETSAQRKARQEIERTEYLKTIKEPEVLFRDFRVDMQKACKELKERKRGNK